MTFGVRAGGIAVRFTQSSQRLAYVSDTTSHCIHSFNIDSKSHSVVAGSSVFPQAGYRDGISASMVQFSTPMGIAFLEDTSAHSQVLLIADSGNHRIRALDTATGITTTWFEPKVWFIGSCVLAFGQP